MTALLILTAGCAEGARFLEVDASGGVVAYPLKRERESIYSSRFRAEALQMMAEHCPQGYRITREGETKGETRNSGLENEELLTTRRFWGLQFQCK